MHKPQPIHRPGLDILATELDRALQINIDLEDKINTLNNRLLEKDQRIETLEKIISSYQSNISSGINNVVLP